MNIRSCKFRIGLPLIVLSIVLFSGCSTTIEIASRWSIDHHSAGSTLETGEWALTAIKDEPILVGFSNDDTCLYVHIIAHNREAARKIVLSGMTLWFDPEGGNTEHIGIHYPMGMRGVRDSFAPEDWESSEHKDGDGGFEDRRNELLKTSLAQVEILGPGKSDREVSPIINLKGMAINIQDEDQRFIYELTVPMKKDITHPYAIGPVSGKNIGIQIKTGSENMGRPRGEMGSDRSGGERPGGGRGEFPGGVGGRGGRGRGPRTGEDRRPESMKPLEIAVKVTLANQPADSIPH
jgi:hypothetical protein